MSDESRFGNSLKVEAYGEEEKRNTILTDAVAGQLHDVWRRPRKKEGGGYEPRIKTTKDQKWIQAHGGETQVDIANTDFLDLPLDMQGENRAAAQGVVEAIMKVINLKGPYTSEEVREWMSEFEGNALVQQHAGEVVHNQWMQRNSAWAPPEQMVPFSKLPPREQLKDIAIVDTAVATASKTQ